MAFSTFNSIQSFLTYVKTQVSSGISYLYTYNYPNLDPSMVLYYPLDDISSNRLSNYGSTVKNIATYDASFVGTGIITTSNNTFITGLGDLSLNNTMGGTATNYVIVDNSFTLNPSSGLSISFWFSSTGVSNTTGTFLSLPSSISSSSINALTNGLVMYWPFDTNTTEYFSGINYVPNGTVSISTTNQKVGSGCLDVTNNSIYGNNLYLNQFNIFRISIAFWINFSFIGGPNDKRVYFSMKNSSIGMYLSNLVGGNTTTTANNVMTFVIYNGGNIYYFKLLDGTGSINTNQWYHMAFVFDNVYLKNIYLNGLPISFTGYDNTSGPLTGSFPRYLVYIPLVTYTDIAFGSVEDGTSRGPCYIDDFRVYSRFLSDSDVATIYSNKISTLITVDSVNSSLDVDISGTNMIYTKLNASFTPTIIPELVMWLDATDSSTFTSTLGIDNNGNSHYKNLWKDKSRLGNDLVQYWGGNETTKNLNPIKLISSSRFGNYPSYFIQQRYGENAGRSPQRSLVETLNPASFPVTLFFVFGADGQSSQLSYLNGGDYLFSSFVTDGNGVNTGYLNLFNNPSDTVTQTSINNSVTNSLSNYNLTIGGNTDNTPTIVMSSSSLNLITIQYNGYNNIATTKIVNYNGTNQYTNLSFNYTFNDTTRALMVYAGGQSLYISECVYYQKALSNSQIQTVEGYLAWKWGLNNRLPVSHPYYTSAPVNIYIFNSIILSTSVLSSITNFNSTSCDDYGNIVIATNSGIFYSSDYGNTLVASSGISGKVNCVSINNNGIGLACTATNLYSSSDYGKTWTIASSAPSLGTTNYYYQVQVTQTGYSYVGTAPKNSRGNGPMDRGEYNRNANGIYYSNDNFKTNMNPMTTGYPTDYWYFTFSSPGYGIICMYYYTLPHYFNGNTWSALPSLGGNSMISMSDNGNYLVSPDYNGAYIFYATITNGTVNTINSYAYIYNNIGFCSVANNGNCLFRGGSVIFNFKNVVVSNTNYAGLEFGAMQSMCFSPSGNYYCLFTSTDSNRLIVKSPYYI